MSKKNLTLQIDSSIFDRIDEISKKARVSKVAIAEISFKLFLDRLDKNQGDWTGIVFEHISGNSNIQSKSVENNQSKAKEEKGGGESSQDENNLGEQQKETTSSKRKESILGDGHQKIKL